MASSIEATALEGMKRAQASAVEHADALSRSFEAQSAEEADRSPDPVGAIVGLKQDEHAYSAAAKILSVAQNITKAVLDLFA